MFSTIIFVSGMLMDPNPIHENHERQMKYPNDRAPIIGISRHRLFDGKGITTLVGLAGCPLRCKYCINKYSWEEANGVLYSPEELYSEVKKDLLYLIASDGGVTFGGGEPLLHSDFILKFISLCDIRLHVNIETSLNIDKENLKKILPVADHFYIDIKDLNDVIYHKYTGQSNLLLKENLHYIVEKNLQHKITIRVPKIPDYNDYYDIDKSFLMLKKWGFSNFDKFEYTVGTEKNNHNDDRKVICDILKHIRIEIARQNSIEYEPHLCSQEKCTTGTCPLCEEELKKLEMELNRKICSGKTINI